MARLLDTVLFRDEESAANQEIQQRQLVGNCCEPVKLDERFRQRTSELPFSVQEDAIIRDEHIVENG